MASDHLEVEETFDVEAGTPLPELAGVAGIGSVSRPTTARMTATYFDTTDLVLVRHGMTLRRRSGGADDGWHAKLPTDAGRQEVHLPLGRSVRTVPAPLRELLVAFTRERPLRPIATVTTQRTTHLLQADDGTVLAEVCDDHVEAEVAEAAGHPASRAAWREWEVELVDGDRDLLAAVTDVFAGIGVQRSDVQSKLVRTLGDRLPLREEATLPSSPTAADVVQQRWEQLVAELLRWDPLVRRDVPDAVHQMRITSRRLRQSLASCRPLLDTARTEPVRDEVGWLAMLLGEARDAEVVRAMVEEVVPDAPTSVRRHLDEAYDAALRRAVSAMRTPRYLALLDALATLVAEPPWTDRAHEPAVPVLGARVRHDLKRTRRRVKAALRTDDAEERAHLLHEARKAVKRLRYAAEPLVTLVGSSAADFADEVHGVQTALGDHHDVVVLRQALHDLADHPSTDGATGFELGAAAAHAESALAEAEARFADAWKRATKKKRRRWLS